jgi:hypothetical protein
MILETRLSESLICKAASLLSVLVVVSLAGEGADGSGVESVAAVEGSSEAALFEFPFDKPFWASVVLYEDAVDCPGET